MGEDILTLFEEFARRYDRGEQPDPRSYLDRAGDGSARLGGLIDRYVQRAPLREPSADEVAVMQAWIEHGDPTLVTLRTRKGLRREAVVEALLAAFRLPAAKRGKLAGYYHRLENGLLDLSRVDGRVLDELARAFGVSRAELAVLPGRSPVAERAFYRQAGAPLSAPSVMEAAPRALEEPGEWDEVDELFLGRPG